MEATIMSRASVRPMLTKAGRLRGRYIVIFFNVWQIKFSRNQRERERERERERGRDIEGQRDEGGREGGEGGGGREGREGERGRRRGRGGEAKREGGEKK